MNLPYLPDETLHTRSQPCVHEEDEEDDALTILSSLRMALQLDASSQSLLDLCRPTPSIKSSP